MSANKSQPRYDFDRDLVWFPLKANGEPVQCAISYEALMTSYGARGAPTKTKALNAFHEYRDTIDSLAKSLIDQGRVNGKNELYIKSGDTLAHLAGIWKDDPTVEEMLEEIYKKRGRPMTEDGD